jgi:hypothetical protein
VFINIFAGLIIQDSLRVPGINRSGIERFLNTFIQILEGAPIILGHTGWIHLVKLKK